jgi:hypothetical protein
MLLVHPSGFYTCLRAPLSQRAEDQRQTSLLKQAWDDSGEVHGYRKLHDDPCDLSEDISPNRVWRLARLAGIREQIGYKKKPGFEVFDYIEFFYNPQRLYVRNGMRHRSPSNSSRN